MDYICSVFDIRLNINYKCKPYATHFLRNSSFDIMFVLSLNHEWAVESQYFTVVSFIN